LSQQEGRVHVIGLDRSGRGDETEQVTQVVIFGASGYSGLELLRILAQHPEVRVVGASSDKWAGRPIKEVVPTFPSRLAFEPHAALLARASGEIAFLATPAKTSIELAPQLLAQNRRVVDLSGAFRLKDRAEYPRWYGFDHPRPDLLETAQYGLPEIDGQLGAPSLVANPGCYATAAILAVTPWLRAGLLDPAEPIFMDGKSGTTGAGRTLEDGLLHAEVAENLRPYRLLGHQHTPEIEQALAKAAGRAVTVSFTAHLIPMRRGLLVSAYGKAAQGVDAEAVKRAFGKAYGDSPFVQLTERAPETAIVTGTNVAAVHSVYDERTRGLIAFCAIDNLVKGAAGQAVQNMNRMLGLPQTLGLMPQGVS
jgi:N-acetyl-gamma-glutamyl-phosphate reductase